MSEFRCPRDSSNESSETPVPVATKPSHLSSTSRAIIKQCVTEVTQIRLSPGYPTVAFDQEQISSILRIVADESARASFEMLNSVVQRASQLSLQEQLKTTSKRRVPRSLAAETDTDTEINCVMTSDFQGKSSRQGFTTDPVSPQDFQSSVNLPPPSTAVASGSQNQETAPLSPEYFSPGAQTLATLQQEALKGTGICKTTKKPSVAHKTAKRSWPRKRMGRVMKEE